jgi:hypothetical protein
MAFKEVHHLRKKVQFYLKTICTLSDLNCLKDGSVERRTLGNGSHDLPSHAQPRDTLRILFANYPLREFSCSALPV